MWSRIIFNVFSLLCILNLNQVAASSLSSFSQEITQQSEIRTKYAKIRIWESDINSRQIGHVSLKTDKSYISLWPDAEDATATYFEFPSKITETPVEEAPAMGMRSPKKDIINEGRKPDFIYHIGLDTFQNDKVDSFWASIIDRYGIIEEEKILFNNIRWRATGGKNMGGEALPIRSEDVIYANCASMVVLTLVVGGFDEKYLQAASSEQILFRAFADFYGTALQYQKDVNNREMSAFLKKYGYLAGSILPRQVKHILESKIKEDFISDMREFIPPRSIIPSLNYELACGEMIEIIDLQIAQRYRDKKRFLDFIKKSGGGEYLFDAFYFSDHIQQAVKNTENRRWWTGAGAGVLAAAALVGYIYS